jgi:hypothetical protein
MPISRLFIPAILRRTEDVLHRGVRLESKGEYLVAFPVRIADPANYNSSWIIFCPCIEHREESGVETAILRCGLKPWYYIFQSAAYPRRLKVCGNRRLGAIAKNATLLFGSVGVIVSGKPVYQAVAALGGAQDFVDGLFFLSGWSAGLSERPCFTHLVL